MELLMGLARNSTNEEIQRAVFDKIAEIRWLSFATTGLDGLPSNRIFDFSMLDDGGLYFGTADGKPVYAELEKCPVGALTACFDHWIMLRLRVQVEHVDAPELWEQFYACNQGTKALYAKSPETFHLYRLKRGEGELFHLHKDDATARLRFSFGGMTAGLQRYTVAESCAGCGVCETVCTPKAITAGTPYAIDPLYCLECGACYNACPTGSILLNDASVWNDMR